MKWSEIKRVKKEATHYRRYRFNTYIGKQLKSEIDIER